jgi:hypothetical protein
VRVRVRVRVQAGACPSRALYGAIVSGDLRAVQMLMRAGVNPAAVHTVSRRGESTSPMHTTAGSYIRRAEDGRTTMSIAKVLAIWGAKLAGKNTSGATPSAVAKVLEHHTLAAWLDRNDKCLPLLIAADSKMPAEATVAMRLGRIDPETCTQKDVAAVRAASVGCPSMVVLAKRCFKGWSASRHWLYHVGVRTAVHSLLAVVERLERRWHGPADGGVGGAGASNRHGDGVRAVAQQSQAQRLPRMPPEIWLLVLVFVRRQDWPVPTPPSAASEPAVIVVAEDVPDEVGEALPVEREVGPVEAAAIVSDSDSNDDSDTDTDADTDGDEDLGAEAGGVNHPRDAT